MQSQVEATQHHRNIILVSIKLSHRVSGIEGLSRHKMLLAKIKEIITIVLKVISIENNLPHVKHTMYVSAWKTTLLTVSLHYNDVTVTKVTDNRIIATLRMIAMAQCMSEMSGYQEGGQGYRHDSLS